MKTSGSAEIVDDFGSASDPTMPFLNRALDPEEAAREIQQGCARWAKPNVKLSIRAIRVSRHKPGKRCLIEYDIEVTSRASATRSFAVLGKATAKRDDRNGYDVLAALWK